MDFKSFGKIPRLDNTRMVITQKIHGTNAQVYIEKLADGEHMVLAGSRTRWLTIGDDNYGFASWVLKNRQSLIEILGPGRHYGEWAGPGINSGEGLKQKTFILFDCWKESESEYGEWPIDIKSVPKIYYGNILSSLEVEGVMNSLKKNRIMACSRLYASRRYRNTNW